MTGILRQVPAKMYAFNIYVASTTITSDKITPISIGRVGAMNIEEVHTAIY